MKLLKKKSGGHWAKNIDAMKQIKPDEFRKLTKTTKHEQRTSLKSVCFTQIFGLFRVCFRQISLYYVWLCRFTKKVTMGKSDNIDILVNIANHGEDAYETQLIVDMPIGIEFKEIRNQVVSIIAFFPD